MKSSLGKKASRVTTRNWFNHWSNEYDQTLGQISFHRELLDLVVRRCGVQKNDQVLDIGCGTGLLTLKLLQKTDCLVTGIDNSREMLSIFEDKIRHLGLEKKVRLRFTDIESADFKGNSFDLAVSTVVLHHLKEKLSTIKKIYKWLKPGGTFVVGEIDMNTTGRHADPERLKRILCVLEKEWIAALKDVGVEAFVRMYQNGIKHILNQGEYCISLEQWAVLCKKAGFCPVTIQRVRHYPCFGSVVAKKPH